MINKYFDQLEEKISNYSSIIASYSISKKSYNFYKGYFSGNIQFKDDSCLDFMEVKDTEIDSKDKYSYHYMGVDNKMIFRYDNACHHKELKTFPHHKHLPDKLKQSEEPDIEKVLYEIYTILNENQQK